MKIPILTYEPMRIDGDAYGENDLKALAADLSHLTQAGFEIRPLRSIVDAWLDNRGADLDGRIAAIACDNGADFDYRDLPHPKWGPQRSVFNILRDFGAAHPGAQPRLNATSFTVVSPEARAALDRTCMLGQGWWSDDWWREAIASGLLHVANHSWDHNHETLPESFSVGVARGNFLAINDERLADHEIRRAAMHLARHAPNPGAGLFAYPYGQLNDFLARDYFPRNGEALGIRAAFTTRAGFLEPGCGRWEIPRFMFRRDWTTPAQLLQVLEAAADRGKKWTAPAAAKAPKAPPPERKRASRLRATLHAPSRSGPLSGLVGARFELEAPVAEERDAFALSLEIDGNGSRRIVPLTLKDGYASLPLNVNTHLLPNGRSRVRAKLQRNGTAVEWQDTFDVEAQNSGPLARTVRESLQARGTPAVLEGFVDSTAFAMADPGLQAWFDRPDAHSHVEALHRDGKIDAAEAATLRAFVDDGYTILPAPIEEPLLAKVDREVDDAIQRKVEGYEYGTSQRIRNLHLRYPAMRTLWKHPVVMRYLELIFGVPARPCQSLTYVFGSQQGAHQDTIHLTPFPAGYMCGVWVALEDVRPNSGELEVYRGSHRLPRVYLEGSGCAKVEDDDWSRFDVTVAARWREMLAMHRFEKVTYRPTRGTVLIWHENLMHAGGARLDTSLSRRSVVSHYFADGAIAFYDSTGLPGHMD